MLKRLTPVIGVALILVALIGLAFAAEGNPRKGKFLYRKNCLTCHQDGGSAMPLGPDSKTMAQWDRAFEPDEIADVDCFAEWQKLSDDDLKDIHAFLRSGALDSPSPAKCK